MRIALHPFDVSDDPARNLAVVERDLEACLKEGVDLLVLPELWISSFAGDAESIAARARDDERRLAEVHAHAAALGVAFVGSTLAGGRRAPRNRAHLAGAHGMHALCDKAHLFRLTGEPLAFERGEEPGRAADCGATRLGAAICYDLRFPEVARGAWRDGAELLCVVAQWGLPRTKHLRALSVGRAVELQGFVACVNRVGQATLGGKVVEYGGECLLVDPDGEVLHESRGHGELRVVEVDIELARTRRRELPVARDDAARLWQPTNRVRETTSER
jgi:predicted amidohydrolase